MKERFMSKMRNGVIKRGKTHTYVVRVKDPATGESKPTWVGGFATHAEAAAARDEARLRARRGEHVGRSPVTVGEHLLTWVEAVDVKATTRSGYRYNIEKHLVPRLGGLPLQDLRPAALSAMYAEIMKSGGRNEQPLGWRSVEFVHATLSSALRSAVEQQLIPVNPAERARLPLKPRPKTREEREAQDVQVFTPDQLRTFLTCAREHRLGAFFHLAAYTGARRGEILHLRWRDAGLDSYQLAIRGSRASIDGEVVEDTPKGGTDRTITLDKGTVAVLRDHRRAQLEDHLQAGPLWVDAGDYVFTTPTGLPIHPDTPSSLMPRLCESAGVPRLRLHDLRHTHATILLTHGAPPHEVADRLGHRDATVTLQVYAKVLEGRRSALADVFASALTDGCAGSS
jgi:integrase